MPGLVHVQRDTEGQEQPRPALWVLPGARPAAHGHGVGNDTLAPLGRGPVPSLRSADEETRVWESKRAARSRPWHRVPAVSAAPFLVNVRFLPARPRVWLPRCLTPVPTTVPELWPQNMVDS